METHNYEWSLVDSVFAIIVLFFLGLIFFFVWVFVTSSHSQKNQEQKDLDQNKRYWKRINPLRNYKKGDGSIYYDEE